MISLREMELTAGLALAEDLDGATLEFHTLLTPVTIPCTASPLLKDFDFIPGGQSPKTTIQACQFRSAAISDVAEDSVLRKGLKCNLRLPGHPAVFAMQLWSGELLSGGAVYQFMLVDANYKA